MFRNSDLFKKKVFDFLSHKWYFDKVYLKVFALSILNWAYSIGIQFWSASINWVEHSVLNGFTSGYYKIKALHSGNVFSYITYMLLLQALISVIALF